MMLTKAYNDIMKGIYYYFDNKKSEIIYIGKDSNIDKNRRHKQHFQSSKYDNQHVNKILQNNPQRYDYNVFIQGDISDKLLNAFERVFIRKYDPTFNFTEGGDGALGYKHSDEIKEKMSGENHHLFGKTLSEEYKQKISNTLKGRTITKQHANRISKAMQGHEVSEETRKKMRKNHADVHGENNARFLKHLPSNKELYIEWRQGTSQKDLSMKYNCGTATIQRRIKKYQDEIKNKPQLRTHGKRKDGKTMYCIYWKGTYLKYSVNKLKLIKWFEENYDEPVICF